MRAVKRLDIFDVSWEGFFKTELRYLAFVCSDWFRLDIYVM